jgi:hypothetical protein
MSSQFKILKKNNATQECTYVTWDMPYNYVRSWILDKNSLQDYGLSQNKNSNKKQNIRAAQESSTDLSRPREDILVLVLHFRLKLYVQFTYLYSLIIIALQM